MTSSGADDGPLVETEGDAEDPPAPDVEAAVALVHGVGPALIRDAESSALIATRAVEFATAAAGAGSLVTTGTVHNSGAETSYDAAPADALVVLLDSAPPITFRIETMRGDLTSAQHFLGGDHEFRYQVTADEQFDLQLTSTRRDTAFETEASGIIMFNGLALQVDVTARGTQTSEVDTTGSQSTQAFETLGIIDSPGLTLHLDETWSVELVTVAGGGSAQAAVRTLNNVLEMGEERYEWDGVRTQKSYRDGRPSSLDTFWMAEGSVRHDGRRFGEYRLDAETIDVDTGGFILFLLELPTDRYELERIAAY